MNERSGFIEQFTAGIVSWRNALFAVGMILLAGSYYIARDLQFDQNIESLYAEGDPQLQKYLESKRLFGGDEFLMIAWPQSDLFVKDENDLTDEAIAKIEALENELNLVEGVNPDSTQTLQRMLHFRLSRGKIIEMVEGALVDEDREVTAVIVRLKPENDADKRAKTFEEVRKVAAAQSPPAYVAGEPIHIHDMFRYVQEDGTILLRFSFILLSIVLLILFRSIRWILLPILIVGLAVNLTCAILVLADVKLSMVSAIMNSIVTIIGVATVTHLAVHYRDYRTEFPPEEALWRTLNDLIPPIFWTCATTAVGFLALMSSEITPVRSFGMMMSLASMMVFLAVIMIVPAGVLSFARFQNDPRSAPAEQKLISLLNVNSRVVGRHPWLILGCLLLVTASSAWGLKRLQVETNFAKNFRESSLLVQALTFVESRLGGAASLEVNFDAPPELTGEYLDKIGALTEELKELHDDRGPYFSAVNSLHDGLKLVPRVPFILNTPRKRLDLVKGIQPEFETSLYNAEEGRMRIFMRTYEQQSADRKHKIMDEATAVARKYFPEAKVSGIFVLLTFLIDSLLSDQLVSFAWAAAGLFLLMTIAFRSPLIGLIGLIPNVFPIVVLIGGMGWLQIPINIGTAMITCVSMGLTVDSSIHYLSSFQRERKRSKSLEETLQRTSQDVGRALIFANLALVAGFIVLTYSQFIPLVYFGVLVSLAMIGGLAGNLVLLPLMLSLLERKKDRLSAVSDQLPATRFDTESEDPA